MKTLNICWDFIKLSSDDLQPCHCCCCEHCVIRRQSNIQKYSKCFNLSGNEIKTNKQTGRNTNKCLFCYVRTVKLMILPLSNALQTILHTETG